jgi:hypothetical protein
MPTTTQPATCKKDETCGVSIIAMLSFVLDLPRLASSLSKFPVDPNQSNELNSCQVHAFSKMGVHLLAYFTIFVLGPRMISHKNV